MRIIGLISLVFLLTSSNICERYEAHVEKVYDGDTITCDIEVGFKIHMVESIRLNRIDAPEVRGVERPLGLITRDSLRALIFDKAVIIDYKGKGKYGRIIAEVYVNNINVSDWLVSKDLAIYKDY
jgi:micrococcal nuclease